MRGFRTHYWRDMKLTFPYDIYRCPKHGIYIFRQGEPELAEFKSLKEDAGISSIPQDQSPQWFDPTIVEMRCPVCGEEWQQYRDFPSESGRGVVFCPNKHEIQREKAIKD
jgi:hypothetical protein